VIKNAGDAINFYKKAFGAQEVMCMPGPDGKSVMHAEIQIGTSRIMLGDEYPQAGFVGPKSLGGTPVTVHLYVDNADATFKKAVDAGAEVLMPLTNMFWGDRYGQLVDPYGHRWSIATHVEDVPEHEMAKRAEAAFSGGGCGEPNA
jgi:uncharacterized glyoxalase superfamily protein PhnB